MASHFKDNLLHGRDHADTHASDNRWRHQESSSFARHAAASPRQADVRDNSKDLANFLNSSRIDPPESAASSTHGRHQPIVVPGTSPVEMSNHNGAAAMDYQEVKCGPLLNFRRMEDNIWYGSVLVVTVTHDIDGSKAPELSLKAAPISQQLEYGQEHELSGGNAETARANGTLNGHGAWETRVRGVKLYADHANTFWRFVLEIPIHEEELEVSYSIAGLRFVNSKKTDRNSFYIPAISESMRIMFHSCNGFSVGTDEEAWSGPALWNDVLRVHRERRLHVMIGGGDQIYNDGIRVHGPLRPWTNIANPKKRREYAFTEKLRKECDDYYVANYLRWYSTEPFASANGQIPQINIWDDHDIIDGFGSYVNEFMQCSVFRGIGGVAHKYYLLFQHHLAPPLSTFTTDVPPSRASADAYQMDRTYVFQDDMGDPSYIIGSKPGPYVEEHSRSIYARLGARIAFFGIDARIERTRHQVNYPETYNIIFDRLRRELSAAAASPSPIRHLVVLLGIPIAYPRLTWLENIFSSPVMGPIKFLNKRFGLAGGLFNNFDGSVDLLDDLDDHYTARTHKKERRYLVEQLQLLAQEFSVRISILGGDVHLAAVGRFYSKPSLNIPVAEDHRYMANIISSAIVNKPPPQAVANLLARRNKIHHLDHETDETLMNFFDMDPGQVNKSTSWNHVTMPSRNWAIITENHSESGALDSTGHTNLAVGHEVNGNAGTSDRPSTAKPKIKDGHSWLHEGEIDAGSTHKAADMERHGKGSDGSLDVCIRVEMDQHDKEGRTRGYGMTIPLLTAMPRGDNVTAGSSAMPGSSGSSSVAPER
ncbi:hypothetical protein F5884DRAFT_367013 [Xylogone sp. PMI_703]|nr:hypothetical protein F5884DRAFT_367013 [Xylogone sp. PMI_703]